jgi:replicative DNA helicase
MRQTKRQPAESHKMPPRFTEGELAILGGMLIDNEAIPCVLEDVSVNDFSLEPHRIAFGAIKALFERNQPVDWVTVTAELKDSGQLESCGGPGFLTDLVDATPSAANIRHYCNTVRDKSTVRQVISAATEIVENGYAGPESVAAYLDESEQRIFRIAERRQQNRFHHVGDLMKDAFETVARLYERKENITGVPSGYKDLDALTAGFQPSDLIIIAGRPSMGKTAFALNIGMHAACQQNIGTAVFSLEMSKEQIALRLLCSKAGVNLRSLRTGWLSQSDWANITLAVGAISEAPLYVDDTPAINTLELRAKARRLKREHNLGLILVDYLQLMKASHRTDKREQEISEISQSLKALAKELRVPVIALSQLNRKVEERPNKRPQLADLRESGAIEQDADVILFIYRDEVYNKAPENPKRGEAEIIIGKQRNGPIGEVTLAFRKETSSFLPLTQREEA